MPPIKELLIDRTGTDHEPEVQTPKEIASNVRVWLKGSGHKIKKTKNGETVQ